MDIPAKLVYELKKRTDLPMMKCKKALVDANGDIDIAIENLRKEGTKTIGKLKDREMKEGLVFTHQAGDAAAAVAVLCETDFVARNAAFQEFGNDLAKQIFDHAPEDRGDGASIAQLKMSDGRTVQEQLDELVGSKIRENMKVGEFVCFRTADGMVSTYVHHNAKIACLVELKGDGLAGHDAVKQLGTELGMQIAFHSQLEGLTRDDIDAAWIAKEREIFVAQAAEMPEDKREKIAEGKLNKRLKEVVLLDQPFIRNDKESVQQHVDAVAKEAGTPVAVSRFARISAGA